MVTSDFLKGKKLYGNDFTIEQIEQWFKEEEEAYSNLKSTNTDKYIYNEMNKFYGYKYLNKNIIANALGIGSAYGEEFTPVLSKIKKITIIEPSENLKSELLKNHKPDYVKPNVDGGINFPDNTFDLITCFGVLHHIPNVSYVLSEMIRVLNNEGYLLIREPIRSMGDWNFPRKGLTKNERGIPHTFFDNEFRKYDDITIVKKTFCDSNFAYKILKKILPFKRDTKKWQIIDKYISLIFKGNINYHPKNSIQKLSPGAVFYVVKKMK